jgi:hypothetical protein
MKKSDIYFTLPVLTDISQFRTNNTHSSRRVLGAKRFYNFHIHKKTGSRRWAFLQFFGGRSWGRLMLNIFEFSFLSIFLPADFADFRRSF